ncbi:MAG: NAD(P)/FAD-dependent oxidoreductase [Anaerolineae bacterium]|nr:NAD(P)/FAD-dependent oxidoreductase [Anaerolineae bacterium]
MSSQTQSSRSVIIIGAGIAGLSTGIYARLNGYHTKIFEMHSLPGGLMTAWKRKGYTIDGCIHWLTGSEPSSNFYPMWADIGLIQKREIIYPDVFNHIEGPNGEELNIYRDVNRLEKHLIELAPEDADFIKSFCGSVRACSGFNPPVESSDNPLIKFFNNLRGLPKMLTVLPHLIRWTNMPMREFSSRFKNPFLAEAMKNLWMPEMSATTFIFTLAWLNDKTAGYPLGGSLPMAQDVEARYRQLGGEIEYNCRVKKILVENNSAVGVLLEDGREVRADTIISAADGHATIFDMLEGRYLDDKIRMVYRDYTPFPPLLLIGLGVNRTFNELPAVNGGFNIYLDKALEIAGEKISHLDCMIYNFDPNLAPEGKTALTVMVGTKYNYWKEISAEPELYESEKKRIAIETIQRLNGRFPGLSDQVEMVDVATPMTFERYTGNWQASFEGWLPTPQAVRASIPMILPGLNHFYMVGHWVQAGGGLPSGIMTGHDVVKQMCKRDGISFKTR